MAELTKRFVFWRRKKNAIVAYGYIIETIRGDYFF